MIARPADPRVRAFVEAIWSTDESVASPHPAYREHVLPSGRMHLVLRLGDDPLRLFANDADQTGRTLTPAVVGGARGSYYVREVARPLRSVGAVLRPGAAPALFGARADLLAGTHTPLEDLWPARDVNSLRDRLASAAGHAERLRLFEAALAGRLASAPFPHPAVLATLSGLGRGLPVGEIVRGSGFSHRRVIDLFASAVGLTPRRYARVRRFHQALRRTDASWTDVSAALGYADQAHFTREFREFAGVTPSAYRAAAPRAGHHVPVPAPSARGQFRSRQKNRREE